MRRWRWQQQLFLAIVLVSLASTATAYTIGAGTCEYNGVQHGLDPTPSQPGTGDFTVEVGGEVVVVTRVCTVVWVWTGEIGSWGRYLAGRVFLVTCFSFLVSMLRCSPPRYLKQSRTPFCWIRNELVEFLPSVVGCLHAWPAYSSSLSLLLLFVLEKKATLLPDSLRLTRIFFFFFSFFVENAARYRGVCSGIWHARHLEGSTSIQGLFDLRCQRQSSTRRHLDRVFR